MAAKTCLLLAWEAESQHIEIEDGVGSSDRETKHVNQNRRTKCRWEVSQALTLDPSFYSCIKRFLSCAKQCSVLVKLKRTNFVELFTDWVKVKATGYAIANIVRMNLKQKRGCFSPVGFFNSVCFCMIIFIDVFVQWFANKLRHADAIWQTRHLASPTCLTWFFCECHEA